MRDHAHRFHVAGRAYALLAALLTVFALTSCVPASKLTSQPEETSITAEVSPESSITEVAPPEETVTTAETIPPQTTAATTMPPVTEPPITTAQTSAPPVVTTIPPTPDPTVKGYYGYALLSESERATYEELSAGIKALQTEISLSLQPGKEEFFRALYALMADNPLFFHLPSTFQYALSNGTRVAYLQLDEYLYTAEQVQDMTTAVIARADQILAYLTPEMSTYERVKKLHDLLILNVSYDSTAQHKQNLYGALVGGKAVCEGYAESFQYLLSRAGIQSAMVTGKELAGNRDHAWNLVRMDDGNWYHVDTTWDDPVGAAPDYIGYKYFLVSDEVILKDHTIFPTVGTTEEKVYVNFYPLPSAPASYPQ